MLSLYLKRHIVSSAPWVFGRTELPSKFKSLEESDIQAKFINQMSLGFSYAFESIIQSYCDKDHEVLKNCLEPSFYSHVSEKLDNFQEKDINFVRLSDQAPKIVPLSINLHLGLYKDRKKNSKSPLKEMPLNSPEFNSMLMSNMPKEYSGIAKCLHFYPMNPLLINNILIAVEAGFYGKPVLGLFREGEQLSKEGPENEYHIVKFETDYDIQGLFRFSLSGFNFTQSIDKMNWIVSDIDDIFRGNTYFRDN